MNPGARPEKVTGASCPPILTTGVVMVSASGGVLGARSPDLTAPRTAPSPVQKISSDSPGRAGELLLTNVKSACRIAPALVVWSITKIPGEIGLTLTLRTALT